MNVAVVRGVLSSPPVRRELASGTTLVHLEVTTRVGEHAAARSVPVACFDAPAWVAELERGAEVAVVGEVRRRFFRAGGATQSRTEIVAGEILRPNQRRRLSTVLAQVAGELTAT